MKKTITSIFAIMLVLVLSLSASAHGNIYTIDGITIEFSENSAFTAENQAVIAQAVIYGIDNSVSTYNLWCTLFGHSELTESYTVIEHCVSSTAPRCKETIQDATMCTRCETLLDIKVITSYYIFCCD